MLYEKNEPIPHYYITFYSSVRTFTVGGDFIVMQHNTATKKTDKRGKKNWQTKGIHAVRGSRFFFFFFYGIVKPHPHVGETTFPYSIPGKEGRII